MKLANRARDIKTGDPITGGDVVVQGPDNANIATITNNAAGGLWSLVRNGQPGITKQTYTAQGQTRVVQGDTSSQAGGFWEAELHHYFEMFGDGYVLDVESELDVVPMSPAAMKVQVKKGFGLVRGVLFPIYDEAETVDGVETARVTIAAAGAQPRKDLVVIRLDRTTDGAATPARYAGRCRLAVKQGTAAATPVVPTATQDANTWEVPLAVVTVAAGATSIAAGAIEKVALPTTINLAYIEEQYARKPLWQGKVASVAVAGNATNVTVTVTCDAGYVATGGGCSADGTGVFETYNGPKDGDEWQCTFTNSSGSSRTGTVRSVCLKF